jgi:ferredoxin
MEYSFRMAGDGPITVELDARRCSGYASCELIAPDVFGLDDHEGKAILLAGSAPADRREALEKAVRSCPTNAISLS